MFRKLFQKRDVYSKKVDAERITFLESKVTTLSCALDEISDQGAISERTIMSLLDNEHSHIDKVCALHTEQFGGVGGIGGSVVLPNAVKRSQFYKWP